MTATKDTAMNEIETREIAVRATVSFCTYVGADCVSAAEGSTIYLPTDRATSLVNAGLVVIVEDAPPAPPQTRVSPYVPPETYSARTHGDPAMPEQPRSDERAAERQTSDNEPDKSDEPDGPEVSTAKPVARKPGKRATPRRRTRPN